MINKLESYCSEFLFTNVNKEGMMQGLDFDKVEKLVEITKNKITVAGGITTIEDIKKLESGDITIGEIYKKIRKQEHQETLKEHQLPEGKYRLLYVDPPWKLGSEPVASTNPDERCYADLVI